MKDKKLSDLTTNDVAKMLLQFLAGVAIFYVIIILIAWLLG